MESPAPYTVGMQQQGAYGHVADAVMAEQSAQPVPSIWAHDNVNMQMSSVQADMATDIELPPPHEPVEEGMEYDEEAGPSTSVPAPIGFPITELASVDGDVEIVDSASTIEEDTAVAKEPDAEEMISYEAPAEALQYEPENAPVEAPQGVAFEGSSLQPVPANDGDIEEEAAPVPRQDAVTAELSDGAGNEEQVSADAVYVSKDATSEAVEPSGDVTAGSEDPTTTVQPSTAGDEDSDEKTAVTAANMAQSVNADVSEEDVGHSSGAADASEITPASLEQTPDVAKSNEAAVDADASPAADEEGGKDHVADDGPAADEEQQEEEQVSLQPVRLTFHEQSFALFSTSDEATGFLAYNATGDSVETVAAPRLDIDDTAFWQPLDELCDKLRVKEALGEFLEDNNETANELVLHFPSLALTLREDSVYARDVSLSSLVELHQGLAFQDSLQIEVSEEPSFIGHYNMLAAQISEAQSHDHSAVSSNDDDEDSSAQEQKQGERDTADDVGEGSHSRQEHTDAEEAVVSNGDVSLDGTHSNEAQASETAPVQVATEVSKDSAVNEESSEQDTGLTGAHQYGDVEHTSEADQDDPAATAARTTDDPLTKEVPEGSQDPNVQTDSGIGDEAREISASEQKPNQHDADAQGHVEGDLDVDNEADGEEQIVEYEEEEEEKREEAAEAAAEEEDVANDEQAAHPSVVAANDDLEPEAEEFGADGYDESAPAESTGEQLGYEEEESPSYEDNEDFADTYETVPETNLYEAQGEEHQAGEEDEVEEAGLTEAAHVISQEADDSGGSSPSKKRSHDAENGESFEAQADVKKSRPS